MKILSYFTSAFILIMMSCGAPGFDIIKMDDDGSDNQKTYTIVGKNNRLSAKSAQGGAHIDSKGLYIDPFLIRETGSDKILQTGFYLIHHNFEVSGGFRPMRKLIFTTDQNIEISKEVTGQEIDYDMANWNAATVNYSSTFTEYGVIRLQKEDFIKILTSNNLAVKVIGGEVTQTYNSDEISRSFQQNMTEFYQDQIEVNSE